MFKRNSGSLRLLHTYYMCLILNDRKNNLNIRMLLELFLLVAVRRVFSHDHHTIIQNIHHETVFNIKLELILHVKSRFFDCF